MPYYRSQKTVTVISEFDKHEKRMRQRLNHFQLQQ